MNETLLSQQAHKFEWDYVKRVNSEPALNSFMEGQKECATHATQIITDLMARISVMELELKRK